LNGGQPEEAINSIKIVLNSSQVDSKTKTRVLNDFVSFVKSNPQYEAELLELTSALAGDDRSSKDLGYYYLKNGEKQKALDYLSRALIETPGDYELIKNVLLLRIDYKQYEAAVEQSMAALELFPAQPLLYLLNAVSNNRLGNPDQALESLELGIDFIVEDPAMKIDYFNELSLAYKQKNNIKKSEAFAQKARDLKQEQE
jgi:tetratricopeptide (TPR) repeat protein